jgi:hypothetical protein
VVPAPIADGDRIGAGVAVGIDPGAHCVASTHFVSDTSTKPGVNFVSAGLDDVAFVNPDGSHVLTAYDNSSQAIPVRRRLARQARH